MKAAFVSLPELYAKLGGLANVLVETGATEIQRDLREQGQKRDREMHQAAIFARAIQASFDVDPHAMFLGFPEDEYSAWDVILLWKKADEVTRLNVQLKELPPVKLSPQVTISVIMQKVIRKMPKSSDTLVAIFVNRDGPAEQIELPDHKFQGMFLYGISQRKPRLVFAIGHIGTQHIEITAPLKLSTPDGV